MACMDGATGRQEGTSVLGGIWCDLRCLSTVAMLACSSGIMVLILGTVGLLCVQMADVVDSIAQLIATASSGNRSSTLVRVDGARI